MGKIKWLGAILVAVSLALIAVSLEGGTAIGRQAEPSQPPLISDGLALPTGGTDILDYELCIANIFVDTNSKGNTCFTGQAELVRQDPVDVGGFATIDIELVSMSLNGSTNGKPVRIQAGSDLGHPDSLGTITEQVEDAGCPCIVVLNVFWEMKCGTDPVGSLSCCDNAPTCPALVNCDDAPDIFFGTSDAVPALGSFSAADSSACLNGTTERATGENLVATVSEQSVGGIAERLGTSAGPDSPVDSSSGSGFSYAALGGALAAAAVAVAVAGWYARRRWLR